jgi:purine-binding chemotaxis protein CheW
MNQTHADIGNRAQELRDAFDRTFSEPLRMHQDSEEEMFGITLAGAKYAVRLTDASGVFANKKIVRVPSGAADLLGVAGFRGAIMPVFDLASIMGYPRSADAAWLLTAAGASIGLAFSAFDGHLRIPRASVMAVDGKAGYGRFVKNLVQDKDGTRAVIDIPVIIETLTKGQA